MNFKNSPVVSNFYLFLAILVFSFSLITVFFIFTFGKEIVNSNTSASNSSVGTGPAIRSTKHLAAIQKFHDARRLNRSPIDVDQMVSSSENRVSQIIGSGRPLDDIVNDMIALLPEAEQSTQILIASHLSDLAERSNMEQMIDILNDSRVGKSAKEVIFSSVYDRDPYEASEWFIHILNEEVSEFSTEARDALSILLQTDHGMNISEWERELEAQKLSLIADD